MATVSIPLTGKDDPEKSFKTFFDQLPEGPRLGEATQVSPLYGMIDLTNTSASVHCSFLSPRAITWKAPAQARHEQAF